ncbi:type III polyketide synthase [Mycobacterium sp. shizuoka-1]|uniref:type III polyketide synthase n=1 Tax=Mycobacterium sp. shizuoka-1 TaxID=2039281 RepID=UPI000C060E46|nr:3-oxoacyl-[acyl-carrier-protein] synthase III C-terminal domain-containing protein [Mycobacterium sp. shizuoka-1]GAY16879.1 polyketide synthase-like Pks10 [Mycobacterium sp. shizuoka-1]
MTDIAFSRSLNKIRVSQRGDPRIAGTAVAFTDHRYNQDEVAAALTSFAEPGFARFARTSGVDHRNLALPLERYPALSGFTEANAAYLEVATELGEQAVRRALDNAHVRPEEVDAIITVSSTGVAVPTIDARIAATLGLRPDVKRIPVFGLGCVAGAAGLARMHDYLRGFPGHIAVLLSVELCSLTLQRDDTSIPALIGVCLFGDGAAAVVGAGAERAPAGLPLHPGPRVLATRSRLFADTVDVMGWNVTSSGFQLVMSRDVPNMAQDHLGEEVDGFLAEQGLTAADIGTWVCHPGGPKVLDAITDAVGVPPEALRHSWQSMRDNGNISSASVLDVLDRTIAEAPAPGSLGMMLAMGPGFSFELLLLAW